MFGAAVTFAENEGCNVTVAQDRDACVMSEMESQYIHRRIPPRGYQGLSAVGQSAGARNDGVTRVKSATHAALSEMKLAENHIGSKSVHNLTNSQRHRRGLGIPPGWFCLILLCLGTHGSHLPRHAGFGIHRFGAAVQRKNGRMGYSGCSKGDVRRDIRSPTQRLFLGEGHRYTPPFGDGFRRRLENDGDDRRAISGGNPAHEFHGDWNYTLTPRQFRLFLSAPLRTAA